MAWCRALRSVRCSIGGVLPGLLMAVVLMIATHIIATRRNMPRDEPVPLSEWPNILFRGALPLSLPVVLLDRHLHWHVHRRPRRLPWRRCTR